MNAEEVGALLAFAAAMSFSPGPNTTLSAALAANAGLKAAWRFIVAVPCGWALLLLLCTLGLGAAIDQRPALRGLLVAAGVAYLMWLAWQLARRAQLGEADPARLRVGFGQGVVLQFVNLKAWMNAWVVSATWIAVDGEVAWRFAQVLPLMMAFGLASNLGYALVGSLWRQWLSQGRRLLWFNRAMAAVLVATAMWMLRL